MTKEQRKIPGNSSAPGLPGFESHFSFENHTPLKGSFLRSLREGRGLSLRAFARMMGYEKTRLIRLEKKTWEQLSIHEIIQVADALGMTFNELLCRMKAHSEKHQFRRGTLKSADFRMAWANGACLNPICNMAPDAAIFAISLKPKSSFPLHLTPQNDLVFYLVVRGSLHVSLGVKECYLKEGEYILIYDRENYELSNTDAFQDVTAMVLSLHRSRFHRPEDGTDPQVH